LKVLCSFTRKTYTVGMFNSVYYIGGRRKALTSLGLKTAADEEKQDPYLGLKAYGGGVAAGVGGNALTNSAMGKYKEEDSLRHVKDLAGQELGFNDAPEAYSKKLVDLHESKFKPTNIGWDPMDAAGPHFRFDNHAINADMAKPSTLAHELGHIQLRESMPNLGKAINLSRQSMPYLGTGAMAAGAFAPGENNPGYAAGAGALASVPTLVDEAYATAKALKNLRSVGYKGNALRVLAPAFGTYLGNTVSNVGQSVAGYETGRGARWLYNKARGED
jgi:hypothetical protein